MNKTDSTSLSVAAERALSFVRDGSRVGLGSGRAARAFLEALARAVGKGLRVVGVPTSDATRELASDLGIPLATLEEVRRLDVTVDGADEIDPKLNLIKGYGGALLREKVVASNSDQFIVMASQEKLVPVLGSRGVLPVEVVPFAAPVVQSRLEGRLGEAPIRQGGKGAYRTDNGNYVLDCRVNAIEDPAGLQEMIQSIPGVVGTGLFIGMADQAIVVENGKIQILARKTI